MSLASSERVCNSGSLFPFFWRLKLFRLIQLSHAFCAKLRNSINFAVFLCEMLKKQQNSSKGPYDRLYSTMEEGQVELRPSSYTSIVVLNEQHIAGKRLLRSVLYFVLCTCESFLFKLLLILKAFS